MSREASAAQSAKSPDRAFGSAGASVALVRLPEEALSLPESCACCGAEALRETRITKAGREFFVGYCEVCAVHVARLLTRRLASSLAALLFGLTLSAGLPILAPWLPLWGCLALSLSGVLLPLCSGWWFRSRAMGHAAEGPAVFFRAAGELVCLRRVWADELIARTGASLRLLRSAPNPARRQALLGACAATLLTTWVYFAQHPTLRVLNLGDAPIQLLVDGRPMGGVDPSSAESPLAGLELRIPAGRRTLLAVSPTGDVLSGADVDVIAGEHHLYAPASWEVCFWLEKVSFGRGKARVERRPLGGSTRFWALSDEVQGWFVPSPAPSDDRRASGGTSTVLRQGSCQPQNSGH